THATTGNGNGRNGNASTVTKTARQATESQVKAIYAITKSKGLNLTALLRDQFNVSRPDDLLLKPARSQWSQEHVEESANQLLIYSELAKPLAEGKPVKLSFAVLTKTKVPDMSLHQVEADPRHVTRTKRIVERIWHAIQAGHFYPNPSPMNCPG